jgi:hypothetical protein
MTSYVRSRARSRWRRSSASRSWRPATATASRRRKRQARARRARPTAVRGAPAAAGCRHPSRAWRRPDPGRGAAGRRHATDRHDHPGAARRTRGGRGLPAGQGTQRTGRARAAPDARHRGRQRRGLRRGLGPRLDQGIDQLPLEHGRDRGAAEEALLPGLPGRARHRRPRRPHPRAREPHAGAQAWPGPLPRRHRPDRRQRRAGATSPMALASKPSPRTSTSSGPLVEGTTADESETRR